MTGRAQTIGQYRCPKKRSRRPRGGPCLVTIAITRPHQPKPRPADDALTFGTVFTDHMFVMEYHEGTGWHDARIVPYAPLSLDPATAVLHYAQAVFDGLKAFRG